MLRRTVELSGSGCRPSAWFLMRPWLMMLILCKTEDFMQQLCFRGTLPLLFPWPKRNNHLNSYKVSYAWRVNKVHVDCCYGDTSNVASICVSLRKLEGKKGRKVCLFYLENLQLSVLIALDDMMDGSVDYFSCVVGSISVETYWNFWCCSYHRLQDGPTITDWGSGEWICMAVFWLSSAWDSRC